jgi:hypothetical protein
MRTVYYYWCIYTSASIYLFIMVVHTLPEQPCAYCSGARGAIPSQFGITIEVRDDAIIMIMLHIYYSLLDAGWLSYCQSARIPSDGSFPPESGVEVSFPPELRREQT